MVQLKLQPYRLRRNRKLSSRIMALLRVSIRIDRVDYKLDLPPEPKVHLAFHVSFRDMVKKDNATMVKV